MATTYSTTVVLGTSVDDVVRKQGISDDGYIVVNPFEPTTSEQVTEALESGKVAISMVSAGALGGYAEVRVVHNPGTSPNVAAIRMSGLTTSATVQVLDTHHLSSSYVESICAVSVPHERVVNQYMLTHR